MSDEALIQRYLQMLNARPAVSVEPVGDRFILSTEGRTWRLTREVFEAEVRNLAALQAARSDTKTIPPPI